MGFLWAGTPGPFVGYAEVYTYHDILPHLNYVYIFSFMLHKDDSAKK